jgi:hypothetical protein
VTMLAWICPGVCQAIPGDFTARQPTARWQPGWQLPGVPSVSGLICSDEGEGQAEATRSSVDGDVTTHHRAGRGPDAERVGAVRVIGAVVAEMVRVVALPRPCLAMRQAT